jgi:20S proteasome alpha/beta subunit
MTSFVIVGDEKRIHNHGMLYGLSVERLHVIGPRNVTVSSGIAWNDCTYNVKNSKEPDV